MLTPIHPSEDRLLGEMEGEYDPEDRCRYHVIITGLKRFQKENTDSGAHKKEFFKQLDAAIAGSVKQELVIFVHGFSVPFEGAITAAGQLTFDTAQQFKNEGTDHPTKRRTNQRAALAVDWASCGSQLLYRGKLAYGVDRDRVADAALMLGQLLQDLGTYVSARTAGRGAASRL